MKVVHIIGILIFLLFIVGSASACSLSLEKSALTATYDSEGQTITYKYVVKNTGKENIKGPIKVTDNKIGTFTIRQSDLASGKSVTGTAIYKIKKADLEKGFVTNTAFATGTYKGKKVTSNQAKATVTAI